MSIEFSIKSNELKKKKREKTCFGKIFHDFSREKEKQKEKFFFFSFKAIRIFYKNKKFLKNCSL